MKNKEYRDLKKEYTRLYRNAQNRIRRAESQHIPTLLGTMDKFKQSHIPPTGTTEMDHYPNITEFNMLTKDRQEQELGQIRLAIENLKNELNNPFSSMLGVKDYIAETLEIDYSDVTKLPVATTMIQDIGGKFESNYTGMQQHGEMRALMDLIDATNNLDEDAKNFLKRYVRERLKKRSYDYDDYFGGAQIEQLIQNINNPKYALEIEGFQDWVKKFYGMQ